MSSMDTSLKPQTRLPFDGPWEHVGRSQPSLDTSPRQQQQGRAEEHTPQ